MESVLVSGIAYDKDQARITLRQVADKPGIAAALFGPLADSGVVVDMIIQNTSLDGHTDITFTIPQKDMKKTVALMQTLQAEIEAKEIIYDSSVAKVSVIGVGMRSHAGVAAKTFAALKSEGINIMMISTSEIKITCLIEEKYGELAVRVLHDQFNLQNDDYLE